MTKVLRIGCCSSGWVVAFCGLGKDDGGSLLMKATEIDQLAKTKRFDAKGRGEKNEPS